MRDERPVIVAVDPDGDAIRRIGEELRRYERDYRIVCGRSVEDALAELEAMRRTGGRVAAVLAARGEDGLRGEQLLERVGDLHPQAKRGLLIEFGAWGDDETAAVIREAMARGHIDYYVLRPWSEPDELFHRTVCEFLHEWRRATDQGRRELTVVADRNSPRAASSCETCSPETASPMPSTRTAPRRAAGSWTRAGAARRASRL